MPNPELLAEEIDAAHRERRLLDAYAVQGALTALRTGRGARRIGWKLGYTSAAMRAQMGWTHPQPRAPAIW